MRVAGEQNANEKRERLKELAFLGWQFYLMQPTGRERKKSYGEWLRDFGLAEEGEKVENIEELKRKALKVAEDIVNMDKGRRRKQ